MHSCLVAALCLYSTLFYADTIGHIFAYPSIFIFECINTCSSPSQLNMWIRSHKASPTTLKQPPSTSMYCILPLNGLSNSSVSLHSPNNCPCCRSHHYIRHFFLPSCFHGTSYSFLHCNSLWLVFCWVPCSPLSTQKTLGSEPLDLTSHTSHAKSKPYPKSSLRKPWWRIVLLQLQMMCLQKNSYNKCNKIRKIMKIIT